MKIRHLKLMSLALAAAPVAVWAQVPDLVNAFDAGGRAVGMGGVTNVTGSDTLSGYYNPAGLGFVTRPTIGITFRNMPESRSVVSGDIGPTGTQRFSTTGQSGSTGLGHAGLAFPLKGRNGSSNGTVALTLTKGGEALYMHCLPADISGVSCKEGEVTEGVFEKYRIATYKEASWKPYIIAAMIMARKFSAPAETLENLIKEAQKRVK